jgi:hypothetical protein
MVDEMMMSPNLSARVPYPSSGGMAWPVWCRDQVIAKRGKRTRPFQLGHLLFENQQRLRAECGLSSRFVGNLLSLL